MKKIIAALALLLVFLCSCSYYSEGGYEFDPGETLSPEIVDSVFATDSGDEVTEKTPAAVKVGADTEVYFTEGGSKFHLYKDCSSLSRSKNVLSGKYSEAKEKGKGECCKYCDKKAGGVEISE